MGVMVLRTDNERGREGIRKSREREERGKMEEGGRRKEEEDGEGEMGSVGKVEMGLVGKVEMGQGGFRREWVRWEMKMHVAIFLLQSICQRKFCIVRKAITDAKIA